MSPEERLVYSRTVGSVLAIVGPKLVKNLGSVLAETCATTFHNDASPSDLPQQRHFERPTHAANRPHALGAAPRVACGVLRDASAAAAAADVAFDQPRGTHTN